MYKEVEFSVGGYTLRGRLYSASGSNARLDEATTEIPMIALHGWLDNCASFAFLAPKLVAANCRIIALDLPGHGRSDHRRGLGAYNIWQDIPEILDVAEQLGWQRFGLLGHSRGAMISCLLAALYPEKINYVGLIDGIVPLPIKAGEVLEQLRKAIDGAQSVKQRPRTWYENFEAAIKAREQGFIALVHEDAKVLAERGVQEEGGRYYWASDKKLLIPSELKFTDVQIKEMMGLLKLDVQLVIGSEGLVSDFAFVLDWLKEFPRVIVHRVQGGHHLHMSEAAAQVAAILIKALPTRAG